MWACVSNLKLNLAADNTSLMDSCQHIVGEQGSLAVGMPKWRATQAMWGPSLQLIQPPQRRDLPGGDAHHPQRHQAAEDHRGDGPQELRGHAGLDGADLVG